MRASPSCQGGAWSCAGFRPEDVAEFVAYRSDPGVARYQSWDAPYPPEQGERFVAELMTAHPDTPGQWFQFAVALRATGQLCQH